MVHKRLHHVGIIFPTIEKMEKFMEMYGLEIDYEGETPYHSKFFFTKMNPDYSDSPIEFLIPSGGVLAEYNNGKGGIHHVCFEVDDVDKACEEFRALGYQMLEEECQIVDEKPKTKINFVRPKSSQGVLVEFMETLEPLVR